MDRELRWMEGLERSVGAGSVSGGSYLRLVLMILHFAVSVPFPVTNPWTVSCHIHEGVMVGMLRLKFEGKVERVVDALTKGSLSELEYDIHLVWRL